MPLINKWKTNSYGQTFAPKGSGLTYRDNQSAARAFGKTGLPESERVGYIQGRAKSDAVMAGYDKKREQLGAKAKSLAYKGR